MQFGTRSVFAMVTAAAVFGLFLRAPTAIAITMIFALPAMVVFVAITSPQRGTALDPTSRPIFKDLLCLWCFLAIGLVVLAGLMFVFPQLPRNLERWRRGDYRSHRFVVVSDLRDDDLPGRNRVLRVYDDEGLVGESRGFYSTLDGSTYLVVSTDRKQYAQGTRVLADVEVRTDGTIHFRPK